MLANKTLSSPSVPWIADHLQSSPTIDLLLSDILEGTAVVVSDGSYFKQYSTAQLHGLFLQRTDVNGLREVESYQE